MLTYKNIRDAVLTYLDQAGDTGVGLDLVKQAVQTAHDKRLSNEKWSFMLSRTEQSITMVSGKRDYPLADGTLSVADFWNYSAAEPMHETPTRSRFKNGVQDSRFHFEFIEDAPSLQPETPVQVVVTGSCVLRYIDDAGQIQEETLTDTTSSGTVATILNVTKMPVNDVDVALTLVASAVTLLSLSAGVYAKQFRQFRLYGDPNVGEVLTYRFYRVPRTPTRDNDIPEIPFPFSNVLIYDALLELSTYNDMQVPIFWATQAQEWDQKIRQQYQEGDGEGSESRQIQEIDTYGG